MSALLEVRDLQGGYGRMQVLSAIELDVHGGEVVAVVGRNGAGKSTLLRAIAGLQRGSMRGSVRVAGVELAGTRPARAVAAGLALVPEGHHVFDELSVDENLRLGAYAARRFRTIDVDQLLSRVFELFPILADRRAMAAGQLSGGQQQMLAIGQALLSDPAVLLLDEPSAGLAPVAVDTIYRAIDELRTEGRGVLVVEQTVANVLAAADRAYLIERGHVALTGSAADLAGDERVRRTVLGLIAPS
jgi:branched-chain amino acid transport system ATP-binding protein